MKLGLRWTETAGERAREQGTRDKKMKMEPASGCIVSSGERMLKCLPPSLSQHLSEEYLPGSLKDSPSALERTIFFLIAAQIAVIGVFVGNVIIFLPISPNFDTSE